MEIQVSLYVYPLALCPLLGGSYAALFPSLTTGLENGTSLNNFDSATNGLDLLIQN
jgi:hypothetical protein